MTSSVTRPARPYDQLRDQTHSSGGAGPSTSAGTVGGGAQWAGGWRPLGSGAVAQVAAAVDGGRFGPGRSAVFGPRLQAQCGRELTAANMVRHRMNSDCVPQYHLRRIGRRPSLPDIASLIDFRKRVTLIGRNSDVVDYVLSSASESRSKSISRTHARVIRSPADNLHRLVDSSLTGVYVNDRKIDGEVILREGDTVTFGRPQSSQVDHGEKVRQPNSEFYFMFELCDCEQEQTTGPTQGPRPSSQVQMQTSMIMPVPCPRFPTPRLFLGAFPAFLPGLLQPVDDVPHLTLERSESTLSRMAWLPYRQPSPERKGTTSQGFDAAGPGTSAVAAPVGASHTLSALPVTMTDCPEVSTLADGSFDSRTAEHRAHLPLSNRGPWSLPTPLSSARLLGESPTERLISRGEASHAKRPPASGKRRRSKAAGMTRHRLFLNQRQEGQSSSGFVGGLAAGVAEVASVPACEHVAVPASCCHAGEVDMVTSPESPALPGGLGPLDGFLSARPTIVGERGRVWNAARGAHGNSAGSNQTSRMSDAKGGSLSTGEPEAEEVAMGTEWAPSVANVTAAVTGVQKATVRGGSRMDVDAMVGHFNKSGSEKIVTEPTVQDSAFTEEVPAASDKGTEGTGHILEDSVPTINGSCRNSARVDAQEVLSQCHLLIEDSSHEQSKAGDVTKASNLFDPNAARWPNCSSQSDVENKDEEEAARNETLTTDPPLQMERRHDSMGDLCLVGEDLVEGISASKEDSDCARTPEILREPDEKPRDVGLTEDISVHNLIFEDRLKSSKTAFVGIEENGDLREEPLSLLVDSDCTERELPLGAVDASPRSIDPGLTAIGESMYPTMDVAEDKMAVDVSKDCIQTVGAVDEPRLADEREVQPMVEPLPVDSLSTADSPAFPAAEQWLSPVTESDLLSNRVAQELSPSVKMGPQCSLTGEPTPVDTSSTAEHLDSSDCAPALDTLHLLEMGDALGLTTETPANSSSGEMPSTVVQLRGKEGNLIVSEAVEPASSLAELEVAYEQEVQEQSVDGLSTRINPEEDGQALTEEWSGMASDTDLVECLELDGSVDCCAHAPKTKDWSMLAVETAVIVCSLPISACPTTGDPLPGGASAGDKNPVCLKVEELCSSSSSSPLLPGDPPGMQELPLNEVGVASQRTEGEHPRTMFGEVTGDFGGFETHKDIPGDSSKPGVAVASIEAVEGQGERNLTDQKGVETDDQRHELGPREDLPPTLGDVADLKPDSKPAHLECKKFPNIPEGSEVPNVEPAGGQFVALLAVSNVKMKEDCLYGEGAGSDIMESSVTLGSRVDAVEVGDQIGKDEDMDVDPTPECTDGTALVASDSANVNLTPVEIIIHSPDSETNESPIGLECDVTDMAVSHQPAQTEVLPVIKRTVKPGQDVFAGRLTAPPKLELTSECVSAANASCDSIAASADPKTRLSEEEVEERPSPERPAVTDTRGELCVIREDKGEGIGPWTEAGDPTGALVKLKVIDTPVAQECWASRTPVEACTWVTGAPWHESLTTVTPGTSPGDTLSRPAQTESLNNVAEGETVDSRGCSAADGPPRGIRVLNSATASSESEENLRCVARLGGPGSPLSGTPVRSEGEVLDWSDAERPPVGHGAAEKPLAKADAGGDQLGLDGSLVGEGHLISGYSAANIQSGAGDLLGVPGHGFTSSTATDKSEPSGDSVGEDQMKIHSSNDYVAVGPGVTSLMENSRSETTEVGGSKWSKNQHRPLNMLDTEDFNLLSTPPPASGQANAAECEGSPASLVGTVPLPCLTAGDARHGYDHKPATLPRPGRDHASENVAEVEDEFSSSREGADIFPALHGPAASAEDCSGKRVHPSAANRGDGDDSRCNQVQFDAEILLDEAPATGNAAERPPSEEGVSVNNSRFNAKWPVDSEVQSVADWPGNVTPSGLSTRLLAREDRQLLGVAFEGELELSGANHQEPAPSDQPRCLAAAGVNQLEQSMAGGIEVAELPQGGAKVKEIGLNANSQFPLDPSGKVNTAGAWEGGFVEDGPAEPIASDPQTTKLQEDIAPGLSSGEEQNEEENVSEELMLRHGNTQIRHLECSSLQGELSVEAFNTTSGAELFGFLDSSLGAEQEVGEGSVQTDDVFGDAATCGPMESSELTDRDDDDDVCSDMCVMQTEVSHICTQVPASLKESGVPAASFTGPQPLQDPSFTNVESSVQEANGDSERVDQTPLCAGEKSAPVSSEKKGLADEMPEEVERSKTPNGSAGPSHSLALKLRAEPCPVGIRAKDLELPMASHSPGTKQPNPRLVMPRLAFEKPTALEAERRDGLRSEDLAEGFNWTTGAELSERLGSSHGAAQGDIEGSVWSQDAFADGMPCGTTGSNELTDRIDANDDACSEVQLICIQVPCSPKVSEVGAPEGEEELSIETDEVSEPGTFDAELIQPTSRHRSIPRKIDFSVVEPAIGNEGDLGRTSVPVKPNKHVREDERLPQDASPLKALSKEVPVSVEEPTDDPQLKGQRSVKDHNSSSAPMLRDPDHLEEQLRFPKGAEGEPLGFVEEHSTERKGDAEAREVTLWEEKGVSVPIELVAQTSSSVGNGMVMTQPYCPNLASKTTERRDLSKDLEQRFINEATLGRCSPTKAGLGLEAENVAISEFGQVHLEDNVIRPNSLSEGGGPQLPEPSDMAQITESQKHLGDRPKPQSAHTGWLDVELGPMQKWHDGTGGSTDLSGMEAADLHNAETGLDVDSMIVSSSPEYLNLQLSESESEREEIASSRKLNGPQRLVPRALKRPCQVEEASASNSTDAGASKRACTSPKTGAGELLPGQGLSLSLLSFYKGLRQYRARFVGKLVRQFFAEHQAPRGCQVLSKVMAVNRRAEVARIVKEFFKTQAAEREPEAVDELRQNMEIEMASTAVQCCTSENSELGQEPREENDSTCLEVSEGREVQQGSSCFIGRGYDYKRLPDGTPISTAAEPSLRVPFDEVSQLDRAIGDSETSAPQEGDRKAAVKMGTIRESSWGDTWQMITSDSRRSPQFGETTDDAQGDHVRAQESSALLEGDGSVPSFCLTVDTGTSPETGEAPCAHVTTEEPSSLPQPSSSIDSQEGLEDDGYVECWSVEVKGSPSSADGLEEPACNGSEDGLLGPPESSGGSLKPFSSALVEYGGEPETDLRCSSSPTGGPIDLASGDARAVGIHHHGRAYSDVSPPSPAASEDNSPSSLSGDLCGMAGLSPAEQLRPDHRNLHRSDDEVCGRLPNAGRGGGSDAPSPGLAVEPQCLPSNGAERGSSAALLRAPRSRAEPVSSFRDGSDWKLEGECSTCRLSSPSPRPQEDSGTAAVLSSRQSGTPQVCDEQRERLLGNTAAGEESEACFVGESFHETLSSSPSPEFKVERLERRGPGEVEAKDLVPRESSELERRSAGRSPAEVEATDLVPRESSELVWTCDLRVEREVIDQETQTGAEEKPHLKMLEYSLTHRGCGHLGGLNVEGESGRPPTDFFTGSLEETAANRETTIEVTNQISSDVMLKEVSSPADCMDSDSDSSPVLQRQARDDDYAALPAHRFPEVLHCVSPLLMETQPASMHSPAERRVPLRQSAPGSDRDVPREEESGGRGRRSVPDWPCAGSPSPPQALSVKRRRTSSPPDRAGLTRAFINRTAHTIQQMAATSPSRESEGPDTDDHVIVIDDSEEEETLMIAVKEESESEDDADGGGFPGSRGQRAAGRPAPSYPAPSGSSRLSGGGCLLSLRSPGVANPAGASSRCSDVPRPNPPERQLPPSPVRSASWLGEVALGADSLGLRRAREANESGRTAPEGGLVTASSHEEPGPGLRGRCRSVSPPIQVPPPSSQQPNESPSLEPLCKPEGVLPSEASPWTQSGLSPSQDRLSLAEPVDTKLPDQLPLPYSSDDDVQFPPPDLDDIYDSQGNSDSDGWRDGCPGSESHDAPTEHGDGRRQAKFYRESHPSQSESDPCPGWDRSRRETRAPACSASEDASEGAGGRRLGPVFPERWDGKSEGANDPLDAASLYPSPEGLPKSSWASSDHDVTCQLRECQLLLQYISQTLQEKGIAEGHMKEWKEQIEKLQQQTVPPRTYVAVIGDTGAGKSSLLNALLEEEAVLPTSAMRACTAVVVEVSHNAHSDHYQAQVEFFTEEEWDNELQTLLNDMTDKMGRLRRPRWDPNSEASAAYGRVKAVYGRILPYLELKQLRDVTQHLGQTTHISHTQAREFRCAVQSFIDSRADNPRGTKGGEFWPIVKRVLISVPKSSVLRTGAVLVDLPGVRDSNAARNCVAKEYLKKCDAVWIVANVTRAVDDKTAKDLLDDSLRRQLLMDGQYGRIAFICTKTDSHNVTEIVSALHLTSKCKTLEDAIADLRNQIEQRQMDLEAWRVELEVMQARNQVEERNTNAKQLELAIKQLELQVTELHARMNRKRSELSLFAIRARNTFCKQKICLNFKCGVQDLKRQAKTEVTDSDDEVEESSDEDEDGVPSPSAGGADPDKLPVFTVSSTEYLKLQGKLLRDGPPQVFSSIKDTEIPTVQRFVHQITLARRALATEVVIRDVATFVSHVVTYLTNRRAQDASFQAQVRETVQICLSNVREFFQQTAEDCNREIGNCFSYIETHLNFGKKFAVNCCEDKVLRWGSQPPSGYPYPTYKATCYRNGTFTSPKCGTIDFNQELTLPMIKPLMVVWNEVFSKTILQHLEKFKAAVLGKLRHFFTDLKQRLSRIELDTRPVDYILSQQLHAVEAKLENFILSLVDVITARQRSISRILTPAVQHEMTPAYTACKSESGSGCFVRMKSHLEQHVRLERNHIFATASRKLMDQLGLLQQEIHCRLKLVLDDICSALLVQFEPMLKPLKIIDEIIPKLVSVCGRVSEVCRRSQIDFTLPKIEESDVEPDLGTLQGEPVGRGTRPFQELDRFLGKAKMMKVGQVDVSPTNPVEVSLDGVVLSYEVSGISRRQSVPFRLLSICEFCPNMHFFILHLRLRHPWQVPGTPAAHNGEMVVILDEQQSPPDFGPWMEAAADRWRGQVEFRKLELGQGVERLRSLAVIFQGTDTKVPAQEESPPASPEPIAEISAFLLAGPSSSLNQQSRKRHWTEGEEFRPKPILQSPPDWHLTGLQDWANIKIQPPTLKKEKRDEEFSNTSRDRSGRSKPPLLQREIWENPEKEDFENQ
ncbi:uncharacterized protein [Heptranchias perlo]|uniref:uncharacterized protein n=1 Tax=Heptranchias perlo TaxID=212740 RepID=UPI00355A0D60